jgi:hypothetical protein
MGIRVDPVAQEPPPNAKIPYPFSPLSAIQTGASASHAAEMNGHGGFAVKPQRSTSFMAGPSGGLR